MNAQLVNHEYIRCGKEFGPIIAETILRDFLPESRREDGICTDIPKDQLERFVESLRIGRVIKQ